MRTLFLLVAAAIALPGVVRADKCVNGQPFYYGPGNRVLCSCPLGWIGPTCSDPASPDLARKCKAVGSTDQCAAGMECAMAPENSSNLRCTCSVDSTNKFCNPDNLTCAKMGCPAGLQCDAEQNACVCAPFSKHPSCQCSGSFQPDEESSRTIRCTMGSSGYCVNVNDPSEACSRTVERSQVPAISLVPADLCETGMQLNALQQCVCAPLSTNPKCTSANTQALAAANVCARFNTGCRKSFSVKYTVNLKGKAIASGTETVDIKKNYMIATKGIVAGTTYEICVTPTKITGWRFIRTKCTRVPATFTCCQTVKASKGATNFSAGCAAYQDTFKGAACR